MLPQGARPAHTPRSTTPASSRRNASQVSDMPMFAARRPGSTCASVTSGGRVMTAVPPPPSTTAVADAATGVRRRPAANDTAKKTIAIARVTIVA